MAPLILSVEGRGVKLPDQASLLQRMPWAERGISLALRMAMSFSAPAGAQGTAVLTRMRDVYAGKWYRTLTFVQRTVMGQVIVSRVAFPRVANQIVG